MQDFKALRIHRQDGRIVPRFERMSVDDLTPGEVLIRVRYSSINYKDALAATGTAPILRKYPLNGGIDLSGEVESSSDARYAPGQPVLVTGCDLSESVDGGYAEYARVAGDSVIPMPDGFNPFRAMVLGTAGFTAALAIHRMEHNGLDPARGPVVVTGASGGVGSVAVDMLAGRGYEVVAVTGKADSGAYLGGLGAARILRRQDIDFGKRPLEATQWAGAIDNVGGEMLTWLTRTMDFWGSIASIGLAGSAALQTTVLPFILRGVNLLGINSSAMLRPTRLAVWKRISTDLRPRHLEALATRTIGFEDLPAALAAFLDGGVTGRTVVKIG